MGIQNRFSGLDARYNYGHIINIQTEIVHTQILSVHVSQHGYFHQRLKIDFSCDKYTFSILKSKRRSNNTSIALSDYNQQRNFSNPFFLLSQLKFEPTIY